MSKPKPGSSSIRRIAIDGHFLNEVQTRLDSGVGSKSLSYLSAPIERHCATQDAEGVKTVRAGKLYVSPSIACLFPGGVPSAPLPQTPFERLSGREREVLRRIVAGSSSADIAQELSLSRKTVDTYRSRLMLKLGVSNRWELVRLVMDNDSEPVQLVAVRRSCPNLPTGSAIQIAYSLACRAGEFCRLKERVDEE